MPSIALVDDRPNDRGTIEKLIASELKRRGETGQWSVVAEAPPSNAEYVLEWMDTNDATALLTDWRLSEGSQRDRAVGYDADQLISAVRQARPAFPIYVITGFEADARSHLKDVEGIFDRNTFVKDIDVILTQILRAATRRHDDHRDALAEFATLSARIATGNANESDLQSMKTLEGHFLRELNQIRTLANALDAMDLVAARAKKLMSDLDIAAPSSSPKRAKANDGRDSGAKGKGKEVNSRPKRGRRSSS